jgi:glycosyltransferase A (GT-A) superfamily protein (DUF2064 family)
MTGPTVGLVVAKAPVPGEVKTRLGRDVGPERAAELAAAALLDTLDRCVEAFGTRRCHLALAGRLEHAARHRELEAALTGWTVHRQRGAGFASRLRHAHEDAGAAGAPVVQVGMDTPQVSAEVLRAAAAQLRTERAAVLGPADDGGWWLLGVATSDLVAGLEQVPMSTARTGAHTAVALRAAGAGVRTTVRLRDVDTSTDAAVVAAQAPHTRFAAAWRAGAGR